MLTCSAFRPSSYACRIPESKVNLPQIQMTFSHTLGIRPVFFRKHYMGTSLRQSMGKVSPAPHIQCALSGKFHLGFWSDMKDQAVRLSDPWRSHLVFCSGEAGEVELSLLYEVPIGSSHSFEGVGFCKPGSKVWLVGMYFSPICTLLTDLISMSELQNQ
jgi:hypothetical protein